MALRTILLLLACGRALAIARKREGPQLADEDTRPGPRRAGARSAGPRSDKEKERLVEQLKNQHEEQLWQQQRKHRRETADLMSRLEKNKQVIHDAEEAHTRVTEAMAAIRKENEKVVGEARASEAKAGGEIQRLSGQIQRLTEENFALKEQAEVAKTQSVAMERKMRKHIAVLEARFKPHQANAESAVAIQEQVRQLHRESRANTQLVERVISRAESLVERLRTQNSELAWQVRAAKSEAEKLRGKVANSLMTMHDSDPDDRETTP